MQGEEKVPEIEVKKQSDTVESLVDRIEKHSNLIKHTAIIHIEGSLSLVDRKVMNILLKNAFEDIETHDKHTIKLADLQKLVGWSTLNDKVIKDSLDTLVGTKIKWNTFGKDKKNATEWTASTLLASANYNKNKGQCEYSYSYHLRKLASKPNIYAKINLLIQREFKSKYSLALWEYLVEFVCSSNGCEYVNITLRDLRTIFGIDDDQYGEFKDFNRSVLKPTVNEINDVSDIKATYEKIRIGRQVTEIAFIVKRKSTFQDIQIQKKRIQGDESFLDFNQNEDSQVEDLQPKIPHVKDSHTEYEQKDPPQDATGSAQNSLFEDGADHTALLTLLTKKSFNFSKRNIQALNGICVIENLKENDIISAIKIVEKNFLSGNVKAPFAQAKVALREGWSEQKKAAPQPKIPEVKDTILEKFTTMPMLDKMVIYPKYGEYLEVCGNGDVKSQIMKWQMEQEIKDILAKIVFG